MILLVAPRYRGAARAALLILLLLAGSVLVRGEPANRRAHYGPGIIRVVHAPARFARRAGDFTANIVGTAAWHVRAIRYSLNGGPWQEAARGRPRIPPPYFVIELAPAELRPATNAVRIEALPYLGPPERHELLFQYDPAPVRLPLRQSWAGADLDVADGLWETVRIGGEWRVRPRPGFEGYDRMLIVAGAFPAARRVETDVIFRWSSEANFGFGVLPLWGGRPEHPGVSPRQGWNFSLLWYWSLYRGAGNEFSYRRGGDPPVWVRSYQNSDLRPGVRYRMIVESWPLLDGEGRHRAYYQRMKWWPADEPEPAGWLDLVDSPASPLPAGPFGVALLAYNCQVDFGPVTVLPLGNDEG